MRVGFGLVLISLSIKEGTVEWAKGRKKGCKEEVVSMDTPLCRVVC